MNRFVLSIDGSHVFTIIPRIGTVLAIVFLLFVLSACQSADSAATPVAEEGAQPTQASQTDSVEPGEEGNEPAESEEIEEGEPVENQTEAETESEPEPPSEPDPIAIEAAWNASPHADSYVLNDAGENNTCARCHAPVNWLPSMDDIPETCLTCKFEVKNPPPLIAESEWEHISCNVCHEVDKKDNVKPEYAWLEIAQIGEYAEVATPTELCLKCHNEIDLPEHGVAQLGGAHADYECTQCHDAHDTVASCGAVDCHDDVVTPAEPIPGHDEDHQSVACVACHDAGEMEVGPVEETGEWMTLIAVSPQGEAAVIPFTSHNTVLEAPCERCHFPGNPWGLTENLSPPP